MFSSFFSSITTGVEQNGHSRRHKINSDTRQHKVLKSTSPPLPLTNFSISFRTVDATNPYRSLLQTNFPLVLTTVLFSQHRIVNSRPFLHLHASEAAVAAGATDMKVFIFTLRLEDISLLRLQNKKPQKLAPCTVAANTVKSLVFVSFSFPLVLTAEFNGLPADISFSYIRLAFS